MPLDPSLKARAEHNERFFKYVSAKHDEFADWAVVAAFYVAVRYVDAYFQSERGDRPVDHIERNRWVATSPKTAMIFRKYRELYQQARTARYELSTFSERDVQRLVSNQLIPIKTHLLRQ